MTADGLGNSTDGERDHSTRVVGSTIRVRRVMLTDVREPWSRAIRQARRPVRLQPPGMSDRDERLCSTNGLNIPRTLNVISFRAPDVRDWDQVPGVERRPAVGCDLRASRLANESQAESSSAVEPRTDGRCKNARDSKLPHPVSQRRGTLRHISSSNLKNASTPERAATHIFLFVCT